MRLILFFLLCISPLAEAEPIPPHVGEWSFTDYLSYYRTSGNYGSPGFSTNSLPNDGSYYSIQDQVTANYDLSPHWRLDASVGYGYAVSDSTYFTYTGSDFTEGSGGIQYWYRRPMWAIVPTLHGGFPFFRINATFNDAMVGEGTVWAEPGSWGFIYLKPWALFGYFGYRYQDSGRAGLLNFNAGASYRFETARLRAGVRGYETAINDSLTNQPGYRNVVLSRVDAGSFRYYAVNPTVAEVYAESDFIFSRELEAGAGIAQSFYGANSAQGFTVTAMIRLRLPGEGSPSVTNNGMDSGFEAPMDRYDEKLFRDANPDHDVDPRPQPKTTKKIKNIDKMMKETERSLEQ
jgi:hypothetical protein